MVSSKFRGLPWKVTMEEVAEFFQKHKVVEGSIVLGQGEDGRRNGWGTCLFESEDEAQRACEELDKEYIGERYIMLYQKSYKDYLKFN